MSTRASPADDAAPHAGRTGLLSRAIPCTFCLLYQPSICGLLPRQHLHGRYTNGLVAVAQLPFVFAFAQKNNIVGAILGYGYEKVRIV